MCDEDDVGRCCSFFNAGTSRRKLRVVGKAEMFARGNKPKLMEKSGGEAFASRLIGR